MNTEDRDLIRETLRYEVRETIAVLAMVSCICMGVASIFLALDCAATRSPYAFVGGVSMAGGARCCGWLANRMNGRHNE